MNPIKRIAALLTLAFFTGCATTGDPPSDELRILRAAATVRTTSQLATYFVIREKPDARPAFVAVSAVLTIAVNDGRFEPGQLQAAIAGLGLSGQTAADITIGIGAALDIYQTYTVRDVPVSFDRTKWFKPVATALIEGINIGLDVTKTERHMRKMGVKAK